MVDASSTFTIEVEVDATNAQRSYANFTSQLRGATSGLDSEINKIEKGINGTGEAAQKLTQNLSTTRYALYDVSRTLAATGAVLLGLAVATTAVAIAWERDFAQVVRTTGVTGDAIGRLRNDLVDLAQTMPVAFGDIAQIATLAGQLGVAEDRVASFTQTVAKFSAVTDLTVDAAATAFGRLDALLPDVQGNYEALGSSIALVGVNSVATESQIVNTAVQISSMGSFAGLTADQVVGLAGALASIGVAPELSRGTITRLFTNMSKAVADGGDTLERFATVAGVSSAEFASAFGTARFGPIFQSFIEGLNDTTRSGGNAVATLEELGIRSVRDVPALLRLAGAGQLLGSAFDDAAEGFGSATELSRQYGIISETTAAKLQVLANNFQALLDAIGSANLGPINGILDALSGFLGLLTDLASTDIGGKILGVVTILSAMIGVLALAGGAMALFGASTIGVQQAINGLVLASPKVAAALLGTSTAAAVASGSMTAAAASARVLATALKAISLVGAILLLPEALGLVANGLANLKYEAEEAGRGLDDAFDRVLKGTDSLAEKLGNTEFTASVTRALSGLSSDTLLLDLKQVDEGLAELANNGNAELASSRFYDLKAAWLAGGHDAAIFNQAMTDTNNALKQTGDAGELAGAGMGTMEEELAAVAAEAEQAEQAIKELRDAVLNFGATSISVEETNIALNRAFNDMAAAAANADASLSGSNDASLTLRDSFIGVDKAARDAALAIIENGGSVDEATEHYNIARDAIIAARIAKGEDADAAATWADSVLGSAAEAEASIAAYSREVNKVPATKDTKLNNNAPQAKGPVDLYRDSIFRIPTSWRTEIVTNYSSTGQVSSRPAPNPNYNYATGGHVLGPGTSTSDSILARLSNNEFVMKAAAVQKYGTGFMHMINSMKLPGFAGGGSVSSSSSGGSPMMGSVVELGPKSLARIGQSVTNNIMLDDEALSRAVQRGNEKRRASGDI